MDQRVKTSGHALPARADERVRPALNLSPNARVVLEKRYLRRGLDGKPIETPEEMFDRVARVVAEPDARYGGDPSVTRDKFYDLLTTLRFFPNSPTFTGAGTPLGQLAACFTPEMRVTTEAGVKPIAELEVGDRVLTHLGRYRPVLECSRRNYEGEILRIKVKLIGTTLRVTPEHPILTPRGWVPAGELQVGDLVALGVPQGVSAAPRFDLAEMAYADELELQVAEASVRARRPSEYQNSGRQAEWVNRFIELTPDLARLCGYYISEGTVDPEERYVRFTFGADEVTYQQDVIDLVERIFGVSARPVKSRQGSWTTLNVYSRVVAAWFRAHLGHHSYGKRVPVWLQFAAPELQEEFLIGVMRGDGMFNQKVYLTSGRKTPKVFRALRLTLGNPGLVQQIWQMALRLGYDAAIRPVDTSYVTDAARETAQISMPPLQSRALVQRAFGVDLPAPDERYVRNTVRRTGENIYFEIESIEGEDYTGLVYNCEVAEDHSYVVEGVAVHNCFVLPIADDMGRDPRGIFSTLRAAALIQQTGGGNGFSFSRLRPRGDRVSTSAGVATGPVGFLRVYDTAFGEVAQGGCLLPETLVFTADGLLRLDEIADAQQLGWQPHNLQVATDEGWHASPRAFNNGVAPVLRVHTRQGLSLAGTPEHRVKVMTREGLAWRALQDLRAGDWILMQLGQHRGRLRALAQPKREHGNQVFPRLPSILDEELAFFIGYLIGDGFVATQEGDHRVGVSVPHNSYLMVEMPALMERLFGVSVHRQQKPADRSVTLVMDNRAVKEFLQKNGLSKSRSHLAQVPRLIRQSPPEIVGAFLRGLFEADGSISHGYPCLTTTSPRLAEEVATLLIGLGCPVKIRSVMPGVSHFGEKVVYHVRIESSVGLQAWRERIGCDPRSRFAACMAWESDLRRESTYVLPNARYWLEPVLEAITLEQVDARGRGRGIKFRSAVPRLRRALLRYLRGERQFTRSAYDELCKQFPEFAEHARSPKDKWFVQVLGVERIGESLTLDLEVEDNHTYLAYGMVTHNTRRGANMAVLRVDHPDIFDFVRCKEKEGAISNFNISVGITDAFMRAVEEDTDFDLVNPRDGKVWRTIRARELFNDIVKHAHHNGEPGVLFLDTANRSNPVPHLYELEATNPCGEQWLGPYENCCLGSINLAQHITPDDRMDWAKLRDTVELSVHFLDNVVDANKYVPAIPELAEAAHRARRIGLGIMGLGDVMYRLGIRYGSRAGEDFAGQVMEFVRYHAMKTSIELAKTRGAFPAIKGSIYDPENLKWTPPKPLEPFTYDWGRPKLDWGEIVIGIKKYGIRNAAQTTIAPTGTIATVAGVESYGCEPVFALAYTRHVNDNGKDLQLEYVSPLFERALIQAGVDEATRKKIFERVRVTGTCQDVDLVPEKIRDTFVVASDITPEEHVRMQAALQAFVDNSISKTINFPETATVEDVERAYFLAWKLGCKGITVYRAGSREQVVLETKATAEKKSAVGDSVSAKKPRPRAVHGSTYEIATPLGKAYVTVNRNGEGEPFEVFCNVGKAGSDTSAVSEAIGRLISLALRLPSPMSPTERLKEIVDQLSGIGGGRSLGFGARRVRSLPDGIAQALAEDLGQVRVEPSESKQIPLFKIGDLCPECGQASFVNEEGCRKCYACGYSEC